MTDPSRIQGAATVRVLISSGIWPPEVGGPASHGPELGRFLADRGHEVTGGDDGGAGGAGARRLSDPRLAEGPAPTHPPAGGRVGGARRGAGSGRRLRDRPVRPLDARGGGAPAPARAQTRQRSRLRAGPPPGGLHGHARGLPGAPSRPTRGAAQGSAPPGDRAGRADHHPQRLSGGDRVRLGRAPGAGPRGPEPGSVGRRHHPAGRAPRPARLPVPDVRVRGPAHSAEESAARDLRAEPGRRRLARGRRRGSVPGRALARDRRRGRMRPGHADGRPAASRRDPVHARRRRVDSAERLGELPARRRRGHGRRDARDRHRGRGRAGDRAFGSQRDCWCRRGTRTPSPPRWRASARTASSGRVSAPERCGRASAIAKTSSTGRSRPSSDGLLRQDAENGPNSAR